MLKHQSPHAGLHNSESQGKAVGVVYSHPYYPVAFLTAKSSHTLLDKMNGALTATHLRRNSRPTESKMARISKRD